MHSGALNTEDRSLSEVHQSVATEHGSRWRRLLAFAGPAYLVSVGYMDPGNWATDLEGGARFGYQLLWVLVASNLMAVLLQTLSARLGIVTGRDLAQACRDEYPRPVSYVLWILCEIAIVACDLAEVLGSAIGLNLLFHIPLLAGVLITAADTLLVLWFSNHGIRRIEAFVLVLIATIAGCFAFELFFAHPNPGEVFTGLWPRLNSQSLYIAVAIFGATVMPHNLYLHSALVQTREFGGSDADKRRASLFNLVDSTIALNGALFVNAAILVMAAAVFFKRHIVVTEIAQAHQLLAPLVGTTAASILFGAALLCSGQSSTITGTMAGQIVMEGFLRFRIQPWLRRAITRFLAITPAVFAIVWYGNQGSYRLIIFSQVILSLQLPFAVIPLINFTGQRRRMGAFANGPWLKLASWICAVVILGLNGWLLWNQTNDWIDHASAHRGWLIFGACAAAALALLLLATIVIWPWMRASAAQRRFTLRGDEAAAPVFAARSYRRILVALDHSDSDAEAVGNAVALARTHNADLILLHVEEDVTSQVFGARASTAETLAGEAYLESIMQSVRNEHVKVRAEIRHGKRPAQQIVQAIQQIQPDLVIMASHGHSGFKDLIFGTTINSVRHRIAAPLLIVRGA